MIPPPPHPQNKKENVFGQRGRATHRHWCSGE
jgi:hypothetical protein